MGKRRIKQRNATVPILNHRKINRHPTQPSQMSATLQYLHLERRLHAGRTLTPLSVCGPGYRKKLKNVKRVK